MSLLAMQEAVEMLEEAGASRVRVQGVHFLWNNPGAGEFRCQ